MRSRVPRLKIPQELLRQYAHIGVPTSMESTRAPAPTIEEQFVCNGRRLTLRELEETLVDEEHWVSRGDARE